MIYVTRIYISGVNIKAFTIGVMMRAYIVRRPASRAFFLGKQKI